MSVSTLPATAAATGLAPFDAAEACAKLRTALGPIPCEALAEIPLSRRA